ncbi:MAG: ATP-binding protein [bacterium]|nr:ATP-binding protein [bacterium]
MEEAQAEVRELLTDALSVVNTQAELVRQLMAYSRYGTEATRKPIEPSPMLEAVANICRNTFDRRIEFVTELDPNLPLILADGAQLQQAVLNLCMNARDVVIEAGGHDSYVALRACLQQEEGERTVSISVQDNGVGIDAAVRERIFDPFFTTKEVGSGTGLGLSIVHGIMRRHGGRITCDSRIGAGTTFQLLLPIAEIGTAAPGRASEPPPPRGHETILIVEDEESVRTTISHALRRLGYRVLLAADGEQGLAVLAREGGLVDLMLLDQSMPRMSGTEVLERMDPDSGPAVILFTGFAASHEFSDRVAAVLEKPLLPRTLIQSVRAVLDDRQG